MVKVQLTSLGQPARLDLTLQGNYSISGKASAALSPGAKLILGYSASNGKLTLTQNGVTSDMGSALKLRRHSCTEESGFRIAQGKMPGNLYPADLYLTVSAKGTGYQLTIVAYVFIEDYLYGVLPYEMGNGAHIEALKAQAVAARTYAMSRMSGSALYDVVDTTQDQVYAGTPSGDANCKAAVDATRGIVMKNSGDFTATYYTASNGGQTESVKNLWGSSAYAYLSVRDDPYDLNNPQSKINSVQVSDGAVQSVSALQTLLLNKARSLTGQANTTIERVTNVVPHTPMYPSPSRLYTKLDFFVNLLVNGAIRETTLSFDIFAELEGPLGLNINSGKNELWNVTRSDDGFLISVRRYGHGIGMSQRGAMYMGSMGYGYDQIIGFYFPGCERVLYALSRSILSAFIPGMESIEEINVFDPAELPEESGTTGLVIAAQASLYQKADPTTSVLLVLLKGAKVEVARETGNLYGVRYGALCGYVEKQWIQFSGAVPGIDIRETKLVGYATVIGTRSLNLRSAPSAASLIYMTVPGGASLPVISLSGNYAYVQYGLRTGYVSLDYLDQSDARPNFLTAGVAHAGFIRSASGAVPFRATPSLTAYVLSYLNDGDPVTVFSMDGSWAEVGTGDARGFLLSQHIEISNTNIKPEEALTALVFTPSGSLNLRASPSNLAQVLKTIPRLTVLKVLNRGQEWTKVVYLVTEGYVMTGFLQFNVDTTTPKPAETPSLDLTPDMPEEYAYVNTGGGSLNLREAQSLTSTCLIKIPQYARVRVLDRQNTWTHCVYGGYPGYVMSVYLRDESAVPSHESSDSSDQDGFVLAKVTSLRSLNLRERADDNARILAVIPLGNLVLVKGQKGKWSQVGYGELEGYVVTAFLSFNLTVDTKTQAPPAESTTPPLQEQPAIQTARPQTGISPDDTRDLSLAAVVSPFSTTFIPGLDSLNLRVGCSLVSSLLMRMQREGSLLILERGDTWCKVLYEGHQGFCLSEYLVLPDR